MKIKVPQRLISNDIMESENYFTDRYTFYHKSFFETKKRGEKVDDKIFKKIVNVKTKTLEQSLLDKVEYHYKEKFIIIPDIDIVLNFDYFIFIVNSKFNIEYIDKDNPVFLTDSDIKIAGFMPKSNYAK